MSRWSYLIPRLVILSLICLAVFIGRDTLIRRWLSYEIQHATGAKAELGLVQSSVSKSCLFINGLKIADPRDPMKNLIQADMAYFSFDPNAFLQRKIVIENGRTSQLMVGVPRTTSGALLDDHEKIAPENPLADYLPRDFGLETQQLGQAWLDKIHPNNGFTSRQIEFELEALAAQLRDQWKQQLPNYREKIEKLRPAIAELNAQMHAEYENPLRDPRRFRAMGEELKRLENESALIRNEVNRLLIGISAQKDSLVAAKTRDEQNLRQLTRSNQFDSQAVSQLLLHQTQGQLTEELVRWINWFHSSIPDPQRDLNPNPGRGIDVVFLGVLPQPNFLIKQLEIEGEGRFAGQHFNFAGTAYNLTNQPDKHDEPATFELRAQGNQHLIVRCQIDRRSETPIDTISIECPELVLESKILGHKESLLVSMGPGSRVQAEINVQVNDHQLSGNLVLRYSDVSLHVDQLNPIAGGEDTALRLNQDLIRVNRFETEVELAGTLKDYQFSLTSDLGSKFSSTVDRVVIAAMEDNIQKQRNRLDSILNAEIQNLENSISQEIQALSRLVTQDALMMAELSESIQSSVEQRLPQIRR